MAIIFLVGNLCTKFTEDFQRFLVGWRFISERQSVAFGFDLDCILVLGSSEPSKAFGHGYLTLNIDGTVDHHLMDLSCQVSVGANIFASGVSVDGYVVELAFLWFLHSFAL